MFRRIIRLLIVLGLFYNIYRRMDPDGLENIMNRLQDMVSNTDNQTTDLIDSDDEQDTQTVYDTGTASIYTGIIDTSSSVELEYILSEDADTVDQTTGTQSNVLEEEDVPKTKPTPPATQKPTTSSNTNKGLTNTDTDDTKALLNAIVQ